MQKKMEMHIHGGDYLTNTNTPKWMQWALKKVFAGKTQVIVLSPVEKKIIEDRYKVKNIQVLPNCVDLTDAKLFKRNYNKEQKVKLLFIGRISHAKGLAIIYNILSGLKKNAVPFKFFLAGTGADEKEYVEKFTSLLGSDFEFKGVVSGKTKTDLYKNSDVFLLPSLFEGLPMSLLEAMSFGLVPVVTNVGSMGFVVTNNENGIITMLNDDTAKILELAITQLIGNGLMQQQLSANAAAFIYKNYSPEDYVTQLNKIYDAA
jgi:glycosyltransferase involved in cell wall biosynthesis